MFNEKSIYHLLPAPIPPRKRIRRNREFLLWNSADVKIREALQIFSMAPNLVNHSRIFLDRQLQLFSTKSNNIVYKIHFDLGYQKQDTFSSEILNSKHCVITLKKQYVLLAICHVCAR